ncbi:MAG: AMP-binding protein, partial [Rhodobacteraceae bacterium]|nr:AMP-binding protein [Paracoccaceae bacterium]
EVTVAFLPFFHIYGQTVLMNVYIANGGGLVTMPRFDLELFLKLNAEHGCRHMWCVPPVAIAMAKHPLVDQFDLSAVEIFCSAAAPLGAELGEAVSQRLNCTAIQGYGMTELSPITHLVRLQTPHPGSVGETTPNTECRIVDPETGNSLGVGEEGEVWIKGPQVMKGYLGRPDATAETITPDGWLRTGDLGSFDGDGYLTIHDRLKELIKVKGFQVAPAELEAMLLNHAAVADAAVFGVPDDEAGERPVAHVVLKPDVTATEEDLQAHILAHLSSYKGLKEVHMVDSIPKSASGKILRRLLRASA